MKTADVRAYVDRDWALVARAKLDRTVAAYRAGGTSWSFALASSLHEHVRRRRPDWPTPASRDEDLAAHVAWQELMAKVARGLGRA